MNEKELMPCPFCGDKRSEFNNGYKCYRVDCGGAGPTYSDPEKALDRWNNAYCWKQLAEKDAALLGIQERLEAEIFTLRAKIKGAEAEISSLCSEVQSLKEKLRALDSEYMEEVKKFGDALAVERAAAGKLIETIEQIRSTNGLQYSDIFAMCDYAIAAYRERHKGEQIENKRSD